MVRHKRPICTNIVCVQITLGISSGLYICKKTWTNIYFKYMNLTDYVVVLLQTSLPLDTIRIILSYVRLPLMQQVNRMFLDRFMKERRIKFRLNELPYQVFSINDVYNHLNDYILRNNIRIKISHFSYRMCGVNYICFYYKDDSYTVNSYTPTDTLFSPINI